MTKSEHFFLEIKDESMHRDSTSEIFSYTSNFGQSLPCVLGHRPLRKLLYPLDRHYDLKNRVIWFEGCIDSPFSSFCQ